MITIRCSRSSLSKINLNMKIHPASISFSYEGQSISASAIILNNNFVLTHASLLAKIFTEEKFESAKNILHVESDKLNVISENDFKSGDVKFIVCYNNSQNIMFSHSKKTSGLLSLKGNVTACNIKNIDETFEPVNLCAFWRCSALTKQIQLMFSNWTIGQTFADKKDQHTIAKHLLPMFLVLKKKSTENCDDFIFHNIIAQLRELSRYVETPIRGQNVYIFSTPFGNSVFLNSLSKGIISKTFGTYGDVFLTDASSTLCSEGGVIVNEDIRLLVGIVLSSVSWWCGEWVGFTISASWGTILSGLDLSVPNRDMQTKNIDNILNYIDNSVVIVRCGDKWGSAVLVNKKEGIFLSCSHVVQNYKIYGANIFWKDQQIPVNLEFKTKDGQAADIAVIKANPSLLYDMIIPAFKNSLIKKGDVVYAAGFPFFNNIDIRKITPTITRGIISNIHLPIMIQTTCCIQSGFSGGGIFSSDGKLIAIIVSNTYNDALGALYPNLNFGVPAEFLMGIINKYIETKDLKLLQGLNLDENYQRLWRLEPTVCKL